MPTRPTLALAAQVCAWRAADGSCVATLKDHEDYVNAVLVIPGDDATATRIVTASDDCTLRVFDLGSGVCLHVLEGHEDSVCALAALSSRTVVSASGDTTLRIWDVESGECVRVLEGHSDYVRTVRAEPPRARCESASGKRQKWACGGGGGGGGPPAGDGAARRRDGGVRWRRLLAESVEDGDGRVRRRDGGPHVVGVGRHYAARRAHHLRRVPSEPQQTAVSAAHEPPAPARPPGSRDTTMRIWEPATGACLHVLEGHTKSVSSICVMGDGRLVSGSGDHTLRIWHLVEEGGEASWLCDAILDGHGRALVAVEALGGDRVVSASNDQTIRIWRLGDYSCERVLRGHEGGVCCLAVTALPHQR